MLRTYDSNLEPGFIPLSGLNEEFAVELFKKYRRNYGDINPRRVT